MPGSLYNLETAIQRRQGVVARSWIYAMYVRFPLLAAADGFITTLLGILPAWAAGSLASRRMRQRRGRETAWDYCVLVFLQGAILGVGLFFGGCWALAFFLGPRFPVGVFWVGLAASPLVGGLARAALTWLRLSNDPGTSRSRFETERTYPTSDRE